MSRSTLGLPEDVLQYLWMHGVRESDALARLRERTGKMEMARMQSSPEQGAFMALLVRVIGARRCVEVGTFTSYSALAVAEALPDDGKIVALDISEEWTNIGKEAWAEAGLQNKIDLRIGPAADSLQTLLDAGEAGQYDFAFIDADKTGYDVYYERCLQRLRPGGLIAVDNVLWGGSVADESDTRDDTVALKALNKKIHGDDRVDAMLCPLGDGLYLARKRGCRYATSAHMRCSRYRSGLRLGSLGSRRLR